ncbi:MAG TPA: lysophospholipid acyltransferase family protein [Pseudolabrys sp.]|jgi:1-acyl-sn-glycerol-3-phosphate acyltransferase|nr:lysophospholipid acyltransferase family protein [Pseudolabrys sp.]
MARALFIAVFFVTMTPLLISIQWVLGKLGLPGWGFICSNYYRVLARLLRIKVRVVGTPPRDRAVLFVSNHVSWADIVVIGSIAPVAFVAKSEVASWPLVGITAKIQRTVFVDRKRRHQATEAVAQIVDRLKRGTSVVLFAEGTSSDGNRVLPFRSALLGAVDEAAEHAGAAEPILIQPMSICYTAQHGMPMSRQQRPLVAWYGDLDFVPHIKALIQQGVIDAVVTYGEPVAADASLDRKTMTKRLEAAVRRLMAGALRGRTLAAEKA